MVEWRVSLQRLTVGTGQAGACVDPSPLHSRMFGSGRYSESYQKRNLDSNPATKPWAYKVSCLKNVLEQQWEWAPNICFYLRPTKAEGAHDLHCLDGLELETG